MPWQVPEWCWSGLMLLLLIELNFKVRLWHNHHVLSLSLRKLELLMAKLELTLELSQGILMQLLGQWSGDDLLLVLSLHLSTQISLVNLSLRNRHRWLRLWHLCLNLWLVDKPNLVITLSLVTTLIVICLLSFKILLLYEIPPFLYLLSIVVPLLPEILLVIIIFEVSIDT